MHDILWMQVHYYIGYDDHVQNYMLIYRYTVPYFVQYLPLWGSWIPALFMAWLSVEIVPDSNEYRHIYVPGVNLPNLHLSDQYHGISGLSTVRYTINTGGGIPVFEALKSKISHVKNKPYIGNAKVCCSQ